MAEPKPGALIRALIVDDEPPARAILREMLKDHPEVEVIGECANGQEAVKALAMQTPDLMFLDIQMPEMDGFALLEALGEERMPTVIFVTAYDRYAVRAFEVAAVDYLLKPFNHTRLAQALQRAKHHLHNHDSADRSRQVIELLHQINARAEYLERFVIKNNGRTLLIPADEVDWIEADGNYLLLHVGQTSHLQRQTLQSMEQRLNPRKFLRIHRSAIVNLDRIQELQTHVNGEDQIVILKDGAQLSLSRRFKEKVSQALGASI